MKSKLSAEEPFSSHRLSGETYVITHLHQDGGHEKKERSWEIIRLTVYMVQVFFFFNLIEF